ncbi:MAG: glutamine amidotransferase-related protein [Candidatus Woesearchaeota archaeon]
MILIINICDEEMHYYEFVKPIENIISASKQSFITRHYKKDYSTIINNDLALSDKIIITGTSLKDMSYSKNLSLFDFLKSYPKPVLAICGGMQILCGIYGCKLVKGEEIGLKTISFDDVFLGIIGSREVYLLHNFSVRDNALLRKSFNVVSKTKYIQAVMHKKFLHYGVLFHPEVRNKDLIVNFLYV